MTRPQWKKAGLEPAFTDFPDGASCVLWSGGHGEGDHLQQGVVVFQVGFLHFSLLSQSHVTLTRGVQVSFFLGHRTACAR